jgi:membrane protein implicated in regulation of membrane protease activity
MRVLGVLCVAFGIVAAIFSVFPIILGENSLQRSVGLGCAGFIALPLFLTGILLTRRAAAKSGPEAEAAASEELQRKAVAVLNVFSRGRTRVGKVDPHGTFMERLRAFDLNSLTLAGWLLVVASGGFLAGEVPLFQMLFLRDRHDDPGPLGGVLFLGGFLLAIVFFCVGRLFLSALGVPISRSVDQAPDPSRQPDRTAEETDRDSGSY